MALEFFFGIALLAVVVYVLLKMLGNVTLGVFLVLVVFLASYLIVGSFPNLNGIPVIGQFIPSTTGDAIAIIKDVVHSVEILGVFRDSNGDLLVTVANTGQLELSDFTAYVDGKKVEILNDRGSLKSKGITTFELDWKDDFKQVTIKTAQTEAQLKLS